KCFRYGGEEFSVITSGKNYEEVLPQAEKFRQAVESSPFILKRAKTKTQIGKKVAVTMSLGIATAFDTTIHPLEIIKMADGALYRAKKNGRNRSEVERRKKKRDK
ncbi:MAG: GGDEF domain-containing protein, partial [Candidatus Muiribacteriota bacterium]